MSGFKVTFGTGFHITFPNGWTASVQWGPGTYSSNHDIFPLSYDGSAVDALEKAKTDSAKGSATAEVAAWPPGRELIELPLEFGGNEVGGYLSPLKVVEFLVWVSSQKEPK